MKILVKIYGDTDWSVLVFGGRQIEDFGMAMSIAELTRYRCKLKLVDKDGITLRKWNNL